jgi:hypothetical protein
LFANPRTGRSYHQEEIQKRYIRKAGFAAKIGDDIGWHTFRHSYRSWLDDTGAPLAVQKELMRHASIQTTMNIYGKAMTDTKRQAHTKVVELVLRKSEIRGKRRPEEADSWYWELMGVCGAPEDLRNLLIRLVAGEGFEPSTFGL